MYPKLRPVRTQPTVHHGRPALALQDPLQLSNQIVIIPQHLVPILPLCDGTRDLDMLRASLAIRSGILLSTSEIAQIVQRLDEALLLDNERFAQAKQRALAEYRAAPYRPPALAGISYPADPNTLREYFDQWIARTSPDGTASADVRAVISPHIDYQRGGSVYAQTWTRASAAIATADLAVIFGTDHNGSLGQITLTRQRYASPFGVLPTDLEVVEAVAEAIGPDRAFAEELHHRTEHSVELAFAWLHYVLGDRTIPVVPILCGSLDHYVQQGSDPAMDSVITAALQALQIATAGRRVLWIAAADLAHVGPAFGDPRPLDLITRAHLRTADERLLRTIEMGNPLAFFRCVQAEQDRWRICGLAPIYLTLRMVTPATGKIVAYQHCPADAENGSVVTIAGALLS